jgi:hypothetical protein
MGLIQLPTFKMRSDEQIVPLQWSHLSSIKLGKHELEYASHIDQYLDYVWENSEDGWSWSGIGRGRVVCVFGVRYVWPGLVEAWFMPGEGMEDHIRSILVGARAVLGDVMSHSDIRRMQIFVKEGHTAALRFAKALNFEVECKLRKFGPEGADYYSMARFE